jgi:hypothetical protein
MLIFEVQSPRVTSSINNYQSIIINQIRSHQPSIRISSHAQVPSLAIAWEELIFRA